MAWRIEQDWGVGADKAEEIRLDEVSRLPEEAMDFRASQLVTPWFPDLAMVSVVKLQTPLNLKQLEAILPEVIFCHLVATVTTTPASSP